MQKKRKELLMDNKEFNRRYKLGNLTAVDFQKIDIEQNKISELIGKPKKNSIEILKRFFKNPFYSAMFFLLLIILAFVIIAPLVSTFSATEKIIANSSEFFTNGLPPASNPMIVDRQISTTNLTSINRLYELYNQYYNFPLPESRSGDVIGETLATYNAYDVLRLQLLSNAVETFTLANSNTAPNAEQFNNILQTVNAYNLNSILGTNKDGLDVWTRTWIAAGQSLGVAFLVSTVTTMIGVFVGIYLGFHVGKWIDTIFLRTVEIFQLLPQIVFFIILVSLLGTNIWSLTLSLILINWADPISGARFWTIIMKDREFVVAAQAAGASKMRLIIFHILPSILGKLFNSYVLRIPSAIFLISSLAFLGFLNDPTDPNLGNVLSRAINDYSNNIWVLVFPGLILLSVTISLQFVAIGLHDALDPRLERSK
ncbi:hypothetical protein CJJ23_03650 [Mycoplasmopsis agassizii]|uniref:ABC transmembrane type-1 domain-containing protein n=2 Tax=Mycoplasmopsis agassizii TaxID=33922 RepID=A0A269TI25_9BACT|nr:hypothetical protein CJJ23_03650 [Mycoplasmopsis agassizii]